MFKITFYVILYINDLYFINRSKKTIFTPKLSTFGPIYLCIFINLKFCYYFTSLKLHHYKLF